MATIKIDDITGSQTDVKPVKMTFDGKQFTLDLSEKSAEAFGAFLADPVNGRAGLVALLAPPAITAPARKPGTRATGDGDGAKAKAWGRTQPGITVPEKGRASRELIDAWKAAGSPNPADAPAASPAAA